MVKLILDAKSIDNLKRAENLFLPIFINLPTAGTYIDKLRFQYPLKIISHNMIFVMCLIDCKPYWLIWTSALETWIIESQLRLLEYMGEHCIQFIPLFVNNIPF